MKIIFVFLLISLICCRTVYTQSDSSHSSLLVTSDIESVSIFIDGNETFLTTPALISDLASGTHKISVKYKGYTVESKVYIYPSTSDTLELDFALTRLEISSNLSRATILVDNKFTGLKSPTLIDNVKAGEIKLSLEKFNHRVERIVKITPNTLNKITFDLKIGNLQINSNMDNAVVIINGNETGDHTPCLLTDLISGDYTLMLRKGNRTVSKQVTVEPDKENIHTINFSPNYKLYSIIGATAIGVVTAAILLDKRKEKSGIPPFTFPGNP